MRSGYNERKGTAFSQVQRADDEDDEDDLYEAMTTSKGQLKLNFPSKTASKAKASTSKASTSKAKPKAKGKAKRVADSEDDDSDAMGSSNTVRGDDMEIDELDDDTATQRSTASGRSGSRKAPAKRAAPARKAAPATIMIDDDDSDSDSGLTFKVREGSPRVAVRRRWLRAMPVSDEARPDCSAPSASDALPLLLSDATGLWEEGSERAWSLRKRTRGGVVAWSICQSYSRTLLAVRPSRYHLYELSTPFPVTLSTPRALSMSRATTGPGRVSSGGATSRGGGQREVDTALGSRAGNSDLSGGSDMVAAFVLRSPCLDKQAPDGEARASSRGRGGSSCLLSRLAQDASLLFALFAHPTRAQISARRRASASTASLFLSHPSLDSKFVNPWRSRPRLPPEYLPPLALDVQPWPPSPLSPFPCPSLRWTTGTRPSSRRLTPPSRPARCTSSLTPSRARLPPTPLRSGPFRRAGRLHRNSRFPWARGTRRSRTTVLGRPSTSGSQLAHNW